MREALKEVENMVINIRVLPVELSTHASLGRLSSIEFPRLMSSFDCVPMSVLLYS